MEGFMTRRFFRTLVASVALLCFAASPASAHHSFAAEYDIDKPITLVGSITKVEWLNPHIYFYIDVKDKDGRAVNWAISGPSPNGLYADGVRKDSLKIGATVTVKGYLAKNGTKLANLKSVADAGGKLLLDRKGDQQQ
jgi:hypothetical protein